MFWIGRSCLDAAFNRFAAFANAVVDDDGVDNLIFSSSLNSLEGRQEIVSFHCWTPQSCCARRQPRRSPSERNLETTHSSSFAGKTAGHTAIYMSSANQMPFLSKEPSESLCRVRLQVTFSVKLSYTDSHFYSCLRVLRSHLHKTLIHVYTISFNPYNIRRWAGALQEFGEETNECLRPSQPLSRRGSQ